MLRGQPLALETGGRGAAQNLPRIQYRALLEDRVISRLVCKPTMKFHLLQKLERENSQKQRGTRGSYGARAPCSSSSQGPEEQERKKSRRRRGKGRGKKRRSGQRKNQTKSERLAKSNMRILYWNCGSLKNRKAEAEKLAYTADILCLQETQRQVIKPRDFQPPVCNDLGMGS